VTATIAMITMTKHTDNFMIVSLQTGLAKIDSGDVSVESSDWMRSCRCWRCCCCRRLLLLSELPVEDNGVARVTLTKYADQRSAAQHIQDAAKENEAVCRYTTRL
jgi:hypothetical protein